MNRLLLLCCVAVVFSENVCRADLPDSTEALRDIEYSKPNGESLKLDVFRPRTSPQPTPVIVFVHGGGWKNGSKKSGEKNAAWLVQEGFAVVSINYRLTDVAQWPAQIDDCYEAVRWVRRNADKYHLDPNHIAAWGTSAGAHLVALMGTRPCPGPEEVSSKIQAACDWFGPADLLTMPPNTLGNGRTESDIANSNGAKLLGATVRDIPDTAKDASALYNVSDDDCPFLIMHGSEDPGVPIDQSRRLHAKLQQTGVASRLHVVKGAGHGGKLFQASESRNVVRAFFTKHLMQNWHQGPGPNANFTSDQGSKPKWNHDNGSGIRWRKTLPETGQSTPVVFGKRLFFTTMKEVTADSELGQDVVAWCCNADTGETLWTRPIPGDFPLRLSGCFSDSSAPPAVTDGERVCFFNASGRITCFDFEGEELWSQPFMPVGRSQPFLHNGNVVFTRQIYMPDEHGHFSHKHKNAPPEEWTNLNALNMKTGEVAWKSVCGVNMGCVPLPVTLEDGRDVILVGRGGGHSPPETPEGVSMISADDGSAIWTCPLPGYMSTQTFPLHGQHALIFHADEHLWINVKTGKIDQRISIVKDVPVFSFDGADSEDQPETETIPSGGKRNIIQTSNLLVGDYHYFRSYTRPYIGRVHAVTGKVEYIRVPVQIRRNDGEVELLMDLDDLPEPLPKDKKKRAFRVGTSISYVAFELNDVRNSRGFEVMGDARSRANGWGHHAAAIPTAIGDEFLYMPVMSGLVYSLKADSAERAVGASLDMNLLGPINKTWTRSSLSFANRCVYAHTIKELICIDGTTK